jgi:hypothetical protein
MKLSKLRFLCNKAIEKYGDMTIGVYDKYYASDVEKEADLHGFKLRILSTDGNLPGEDIDDSEQFSKTPTAYYACIFYEN